MTTETITTPSRMRAMTALGADWWNDSGIPAEVGEAVALGAVGGTSNPVIVAQAVESNPELCQPLLEQLIKDNPTAIEDEIAWKLIHRLGTDAAAELRPVFDATGGAKGFLSMQVNPKFYPSPEKMVEQAVELTSLAPNIAIKAPANAAGLIAIEEMTARGIRVNVTVSFTVAQVIAAGEAIARGQKRAKENGCLDDRGSPCITHMVGRVDDQLGRAAIDQGVDPKLPAIAWSGIAVFKRARAELKQRGLPGTLLAAAYRHEGHWAEIIGTDVLQTVPYTWWKKFDKSEREPALTIDTPVDPALIAELSATFPDFVRAYEPDGMKPSEFGQYGATQHTLQQFLGGYCDLLNLVRASMLKHA
ncbi:transaldolase family protein [Pelagicoccus enzymogenes]|uniref:transaldolase family protein n=1 Tax=Pelagicoccus enzymogenes TaxID=2773457 RepID=UPI00280FDD11|nr:transaldolase family protein [Pelagicoccus enzymogenes]MDQ8199749.1 transaldolase family protein [Pelagicoccus enzymogenes]